jgi:hypothetical protein
MAVIDAPTCERSGDAVVRFLNNLKIATKIGLIIALLSLVMAGSIGLSMVRMMDVTDEFKALIAREDAGTLYPARAARPVESYRDAAYAVLPETTEAGNAASLSIPRNSARGVIERPAPLGAGVRLEKD